MAKGCHDSKSTNFFFKSGYTVVMVTHYIEKDDCNLFSNNWALFN